MLLTLPLASSMPFIVEATRGACVERRHVVVAAIVDKSGDLVGAFGDTDLVVPVRSTVKVIQALPLVRSGAADALEVTDKQLALASGSHSGDAEHCEAVRAWLDSLGFDESALHCAPSLPMLPDAAEAYLRAGGLPTRMHHSCSGKHVGFLALTRHFRSDPAKYLDLDHPVQVAVLAALADAFRTDVSKLQVARDGCGAPVVCVSVACLACALARMSAAPGGSVERRLLDAMAAYPHFIAGSGRFDTRISEVTSGRVITKMGADGVHVAAVRDLEVGVAVKVIDGDRRAGELALLSVLHELGTVAVDDELADLSEPMVTDDRGEAIGLLRLIRPVPTTIVPGWPEKAQ